ncbi:MAG: T9SS type A sorting domain-containing protein [Chitinophagaceae bacterium]|nr:T9SS type A sorting domain-containing protein [Chitinophagaceae bacterium]
MKKNLLLLIFFFCAAKYAQAQANWIYSNNYVINSNYTDDSVFAHCDTSLFRVVDDTLQIGFYIGSVGSSCPVEYKYSPVVNDSMKVRFSWVQNPVCNMDDPEWCVTLKLMPCDSFNSMKVWLSNSLSFDDSLNGNWYQITKNPNCTITAGFAVGIEYFDWSVTSSLQNDIIWNTKNETNISYFEVQRSEDAQTFETFARVASQGNGINTYRVSDALRNISLHYRIKIADRDGKFIYTQAKSVAPVKEQQSIVVFPNPAKGFFNIRFDRFEQNEVQLTLSDVVGRSVYQNNFNINKNNFSYGVDLQSFTKGYYILHLNISENENTLTFPLIIE